MFKARVRLLPIVCLCVAIWLTPNQVQASTVQQYIPILTYHHIAIHIGRWYVSPTKFEEELAYLASQQYHSISMEAYMDALQNHQLLPAKSVVLTFDDGYEDAYTSAFPLLTKYGMTGTFFIVTGRVGQPDYLTWDEIRQMHQAKMEFGAHTVHHAYLTMTTRSRAFLEIWLSKVTLEFYLGQPINIFAYPYNDHNPAVVDLTKLAGFRGACIVNFHQGDTPDNLYEIPRVSILAGESMNTFKIVLTHNVNVNVKHQK